MKFIRNTCRRASYNIALDTWLLYHFQPDAPIFLLWQNENAVIVGKNQNTFQEVNLEYVEAKSIEVIRRVSGGGAVYHDLGNLNFTFIVPIEDHRSVNFKDFVQPMVDALASLGINASMTGRNDLEIDGKKISGNAQRYANSYLMHHGTLLFDANIETMVEALNVSDEKFISKAAKSVRARVGRIKDSRPDLTMTEFQVALTNTLADGDEEIVLTDDQIAEVERLECEQFATWDWNYGASPDFNYHEHGKFPGGSVDIFAQVSGGVIQAIDIQGDYLGLYDNQAFLKSLVGVAFSKEVILEKLEEVAEFQYFGSVSNQEIVSLVH
jgi:lipoate-protein ligase A